MAEYDFRGYATKANIKCSDGRTILKDAFKDNDGTTVPLVWQHMHDAPENILGHAILENREDGVYAYCTFNDNPKGVVAKGLVKHGDITALSIYANSLVQKGKDVVHGVIREVSLVLAGANKGAFIENIAFEHADGSVMEELDEAIIYHGISFDKEETNEIIEEKKVFHTDLSKETLESLEQRLLKVEETISHATAPTVGEILQTLNDEQRSFVEMYLIHRFYTEDEIAEARAEVEQDENIDTENAKTMDEIFNSMTDEQKNAFYTVAELIEENFAKDLEDLEKEDTTIQQNDGGNKEMKVNVFDNNSEESQKVLKHTAADVKAAIDDARKIGSMKESFIQHSIEDVEFLYPEATAITGEPNMVTRLPYSWVTFINNNTRHVPFARIKSYAVDLTAEEARAKGYVKGNLKVDEVIKALRRITNPTTIYKTQNLDRDDVIDITDFDVVAFLKREMRHMLDEEIARAVLIGDGRDAVSPDKINQEAIRPIYTDVFPYAFRYTLAENLPLLDLIDSIIAARKEWYGTGVPSLFASTSLVTDMLLVRGNIDNRRLYGTEQELASELRVSNILEVPAMENITRVNADGDTVQLKAILVNPRDYTIGANAGGRVSFFDDFDIDYNKQKYLIETRISGALTVPRSAVIFEQIIPTP